jgi:hypothetical protein
VALLEEIGAQVIRLSSVAQDMSERRLSTFAERWSLRQPSRGRALVHLGNFVETETHRGPQIAMLRIVNLRISMAYEPPRSVQTKSAAVSEPLNPQMHQNPRLPMALRSCVVSGMRVTARQMRR